MYVLNSSINWKLRQLCSSENGILSPPLPHPASVQLPQGYTSQILPPYLQWAHRQTLTLHSLKLNLIRETQDLLAGWGLRVRLFITSKARLTLDKTLDQWELKARGQQPSGDEVLFHCLLDLGPLWTPKVPLLFPIHMAHRQERI